jgi:hypothetical protein
VAATVSPNPTDNDTVENEGPDPAINLHLTEMMQSIEGTAEGGKDRESCSPPKQKKKASQTTFSAKTTNGPGKKAHTIIDMHVHKFSWTILDRAIKLKNANPLFRNTLSLSKTCSRMDSWWIPTLHFSQSKQTAEIRKSTSNRASRST